MRRTGLAAALALLMLAFLWNGDLTAQAVRDGLALCARSVIPSLFPFFVAVSCFTSLGLARDCGRLLAPLTAPVLGCSGAGSVAFLLGLLGGYPVGGRAVAELYRTGSVDRDEAMHLLAFCNNCGPAFVLGVAGRARFGSMGAGLWLWAIHVAAALLTAQLHRGRGSRSAPLRPDAPALSLPDAFLRAVIDGAETMLQVCAFVVFFLAVLRLVTVLTGLSHPALAGAVELTGGISLLTPDRAGFITAAALLGWGGLSVHCQTVAALRGTDLSLRPQLAGKALQAALSASLAAVVSIWLF
ncbi:MAG: sporulation protein [Ruminococcaceae bacterium]|nr:sporulation protein [Oscillospiraceae bacterium]